MCRLPSSILPAGGAGSGRKLTLPVGLPLPFWRTCTRVARDDERKPRSLSFYVFWLILFSFWSQIVRSRSLLEFGVGKGHRVHALKGLGGAGGRGGVFQLGALVCCVVKFRILCTLNECELA